MSRTPAGQSFHDRSSVSRRERSPPAILVPRNPIPHTYLFFRRLCPPEKSGRIDATKVHFNTEARFYLIQTGMECFTFSDREQEILRPGDAIFVNALRLYSRKTVGSKPSSAFCLGFAPSSFSDFPIQCNPFTHPLTESPNAQWFVLRKCSEGVQNELLSLLGRITSGVTEENEEQQILHRICLSIIRIAGIKSIRTQKGVGTRLNRYIALRDRIWKECSRGRVMRPDGIAYAEGLTVREAENCFREFGKCSIREYSIGSRLRMAVFHMSRFGMSTEAAAKRFSFSSASNFTRDFRKYYGTTPKRFCEMTKRFLPEKVPFSSTNRHGRITESPLFPGQRWVGPFSDPE